MDVISEQHLLDVHPKLSALIHQLFSQAVEHEIEFRVTQGLRTWAAQASLWAQGRTLPGKIVTNSPPGHSWHEFGLAVDFVVWENGAPDWSLKNPKWKAIEQAGQKLGLVSGSCWHHPDAPHFQLTGRFPVSPTSEVRELYANGGLAVVWVASGLDKPATSTKTVEVASP